MSKDLINKITVTNDDNIDNETIYKIGNAYFDGNGLPKNSQKALNLLKVSANNSHIESQYLVGMIAMEVFDDIDTALSYFKLASDASHKKASWEIAMIFDGDKGGKKNAKLAAHWISIAAKQGYTRAIKLVNLNSTMTYIPSELNDYYYDRYDHGSDLIDFDEYDHDDHESVNIDEEEQDPIIM